MLGRWWRARREARVLARRPIPESLWQSTLARYPFLARLDAGERAQLRRLATLFLAGKEFTGAGGLKVDDRMAVTVAAQACLPVLRLGLSPYDGFVGIVLHPAEVRARRRHTDAHGVVHEGEEVLAGEAMENGPLMLSWADVQAAGSTPEDRPYNVVIHEFVHVLDAGDGAINGRPPLPHAAARRHWDQVMAAGRARLARAVEAGRPSVLDPYGASSVEEFFPVAAEAFFLSPRRLREEAPAVYESLAQYFHQDPAAAPDPSAG